MKIVIHTILIGLAIKLTACADSRAEVAEIASPPHEVKSREPYLKPVQYGIQFFTVSDNRDKRQPNTNVSIIPENIRKLLIQTKTACARVKDEKLAIRIMYAYVETKENDARGIFVGIEIEDSDGKLYRIMYSFDAEESSFIDKSILELQKIRPAKERKKGGGKKSE